MMFAPICGFLGDRYNRKWIMVAGLSVWVSAVLASSFIPAGGIWFFVLLRGIVGIGEASYAVIAPTMIADLFYAKLRSKVFMFFYFAIPVGSGLGYVVGSGVASVLGGWQWGIRVTPFLGVLLIVCLALFVEEPTRGMADRVGNVEDGDLRVPSDSMLALHNAPAEPNTGSYLGDLKYLISIRTYIWSIIGYTFVVFVTGTVAWWAPASINHALAWDAGLNDTSQLSPQVRREVSLTFGGITVLAGLFGVSAGTAISSIWKEGRFCCKPWKTMRADALISAIGSFCAVPFMFAGFYLIHVKVLVAWIAIFLAILFLCLNWAINVDMLMHIIVPQRRSTANSWMILLSHLFGDASGPYIIGIISDWLRGADASPKAHYYSLLHAFYVPNLLLILSGVSFLFCAKYLPYDIREFKKAMGLDADRQDVHPAPIRPPLAGAQQQQQAAARSEVHSPLTERDGGRDNSAFSAN